MEQLLEPVIVCPYCHEKYEDHDSDAVFNHEDGVLTIVCPECEKSLEVERITTVAFTSNCIDKYYKGE